MNISSKSNDSDDNFSRVNDLSVTSEYEMTNFEGGTPQSSKAADYMANLVSVKVSHRITNEQNGLYDLVFTDDVQTLYKDLKTQNDEHKKEFPGFIESQKIETLEPLIQSEKMDKGSILVLGQHHLSLGRLRLKESVKQLDIFVDKTTPDYEKYLVATVEDAFKDTYLVIANFDIDQANFNPQKEFKVKLTYDHAVGSKCHYKTSRCWKGFRDHIYYYKMENYRHEQLWKIKPSTGEQTMIQEWTNTYKTWDLQFQNDYQPEEEKYENGLTQPFDTNPYDKKDDEEWLRNTFIAKLVSNIDDTQLKVQVHSILREKEVTAYSYTEVSAMYDEISPPLSVLLLIDQNKVLNISSGNQNAFLDKDFRATNSTIDQMKYFLKAASRIKKIKIQKTTQNEQIQFNNEETTDVSDSLQQVLIKSQEIIYLDLEDEKTERGIRFSNADTDIVIFKIGIDHVSRPVVPNEIFRHYLTGYEWPIYQPFSNLSNVFHYRDFSKNVEKEEITVWDKNKNHWIIGASFSRSEINLDRKLDYNHEELILPWFVDHQMYKRNIPCIKTSINDKEEVTLTLNFMNIHGLNFEISSLEIIPAQQYDDPTKSSLLFKEMNGIQNCVQICQSSNLRSDNSQDVVVVYRNGRDTKINLIFQEFRIQYNEDNTSASAALISSKVYITNATLQKRWKVLPLFESEDSQVVRGVNLFEDNMIIQGYEEGDIINIGIKEFEISADEKKKDDADFNFGPKTLWMNKRFPRPFKLSFDYRFDNAGEMIPIYAHYQENWQASEAARYGITWYAATNRSDFTFRTKIFGAFPQTKREGGGFNMKIGQWYTMDSTIDGTECSYSIDGKFYAKAINMKHGDVPESGFFGMIHYSGDQHRSIKNMKLTKLRAKYNSKWTICQSFKNFQENDYQIRTEIGSVGYKIYNDKWTLFMKKGSQGILLEARINKVLYDDSTYHQQKDLLDRLTQTLSNMVPRQSQKSPQQYFNNIQNKNEDFLQPFEIFLGKSVASFIDTDKIIKKINHIEYECTEEESLSRAYQPLVNIFAGDDHELQLILKKIGLGIREKLEGSDDFHLQTTFEERLIRNDLQSFKLLFKLLQNQKNITGAHIIIMRNIHLIAYTKPEFQLALGDFMKECDECDFKLTFGLKVESDLLPKYSKRSHIRPLNIETKTQQKMRFEQLEGDEHFLQLTEEGTQTYLKVGEQIVIDGAEEIETEGQEMAVKHYFINFGDVKMQNKISKAKDQWQSEEEQKIQEMFVTLDDPTFADFFATNNSLFVHDIEQQLLLKNMMEYQFKLTYRYFMIQFGIYIAFYVLPIVYYIFNEKNGVLQDEKENNIVFTLALVTQLIFLIPEVINIINDGVYLYITDVWNIIDVIGFVSFLIFYITKDDASMKDEKEYILILLIFLMLFKINFLLRVNAGFGLLVTLVKTAIKEMIPFTLYFVIWLITFVLLYKVTGQEATGRTGFHDNTFFNFLLLVFENSIGNINDPSFNTEIYKGTKGYILWGVWWFNQWMIVIILLNFLIAVISQSYENVMNSATILKFKDIAQLNREAYHVLKHVPNTHMVYTNRIILTIPDEEHEQIGDEGWTGFVQTLKTYIKGNVTSQIKSVSSKVTRLEDKLIKRFDHLAQLISKKPISVAKSEHEPRDRDGFGDEDEDKPENEQFPEGTLAIIFSRKNQSWQSSEETIGMQNGRMYETEELQTLLDKIGAILPG